jgi:aspartyl-tRNA(Asn)/glutamyl-tRNA(Gln) amidotransferase subunit B
MSYLIDGKTGKWEVVIGLEVHCQIISKAKLFSGSSATFGAEPNANVSFIDLALPGVLPNPNKFCIEQGVKTGLALNCDINLISYFDRKHYFYPDSPFGYQITQFYKPIAENGYMIIDLENGNVKKIFIERLHIEQDAGKLLHEHHPNKSFVDLNRAGVGLMEIVSAPDMRSKEEAASYVNNLRTLVRYIGTCDANMEEGSMRCDINVSVRKPGEEYRTRVEIKNVNSVKFLQQAIDYEVQSQIEIWESGGVVHQETKLFNPSVGKTYSLRKKEDAGDYRYMRDPDLLPLVLEKSYVDNLKQSIPELPQKKKERFVNNFNLSDYEANLLASDRDYAIFFEESVFHQDSKLLNPKLIASWITTNLFSYLNKDNVEITNSKITPINLAKLIDLIQNEVISSKIAKDVFEEMWQNGNNPEEIVKEKGWEQITDSASIEKVVDSVLNNNPDKVAEIKAGKEKLLGWFVGQIMKETQGKANPDILNLLLKKKILE